MITQETNPVLWKKLRRQWASEGQPSTLAAGQTHYTVIQHAESKQVAFIPANQGQFYGDSSMTGVTK